MDARQPLETIIEAISSSSGLNELSFLMKDICQMYGLTNLVYHGIHVGGHKPENPVLLLTCNSDWVGRYYERNYFQVDPVILDTERHFLPVDWTELAESSRSARDFFAEAERFGVGRRGTTIPIRGPLGERAFFTLTSNTSGETWKNLRNTSLQHLHLVSHYLHDKVMELSGYRRQVEKNSLSRRERECLQCVARGVAPKRIAGDLSLSESAIRFYLLSARRKLDCATTSQAVAKAIWLEMIRP